MLRLVDRKLTVARHPQTGPANKQLIFDANRGVQSKTLVIANLCKRASYLAELVLPSWSMM